ncbi:hypothetical protein G6L37_01795 [Agrobacterium rubi]|nr:hypothetical protein [Agrobacterium rubi]NTF24126.1 hypothetical protein [Agrobacterium rubi]
MRHFFNNNSRPKSVAKALRAEMARHGFTLTHSDSLLLSAKFYHYRNWADLLANLGRQNPSHDDGLAGSAVASTRFDHHVAVLSEHGVDTKIATDIVRKIGPTSSGTRERRGREELWINDAAVTSYLEGLAFRIAAEAIDVVPQRHGTWLGFRALFENIRPGQASTSWEYHVRLHGNQMIFGVSDDGRSAILLKEEDLDFKAAVDDRIRNRDQGSSDEWGFLDGYPDVFDHSRQHGGAEIIQEVFSRLHTPSMRALRSAGLIREEDYEKAVASDRVRNFLHLYPSLSDHCFWSLGLPKEYEQRGSARWIEGTDPDTALMAMLTRGNLPSGQALSRVRSVAEALRGHAVTSDGNEFFSTEALQALTHLGPTAIPSTKSEMRHLIRCAEHVSEIIPYGMDLTRAFDGFPGTWKTFFEAIRRSDTHNSDSLNWWPDSFVYLISSAFGQTYGIDPSLLYDSNFSNAVLDRIGPVMMSRMSMRDIASLSKVIEAHRAEVAYNKEERYPSVAEADELAVLFALPMPDAYHGKSCIEILEQAGYIPDVLAGMLKLEPDLNFDDMGLPMMEERFKGLDPSTYAIKKLEMPGFKEPEKPPRQRPVPMSPPDVPKAPDGWVFEGGEFKSAASWPPSRIRWSDGSNELIGTGPGWYADRGLGRDPIGSEPRCPVRLGRFETPADAADAIRNAKGYHG